MTRHYFALGRETPPSDPNNTFWISLESLESWIEVLEAISARETEPITTKVGKAMKGLNSVLISAKLAWEANESNEVESTPDDQGNEDEDDEDEGVSKEGNDDSVTGNEGGEKKREEGKYKYHEEDHVYVDPPVSHPICFLF